MASAGVNMPGGDGNPGAASSSSTTECRLRRRRRLAPPRATVAAGGPSEEKRIRPSSASEEEEGQEGEADAVLKEEEEGGTQQQQLPLSAAGPQPPPSPGAAARAWPVAFGWLSVAGRSREMEDAVSLRPGFCTWIDGSPMHFFGVFDGHGGSHVSTLCRDRMHEFLAEELAAEGAALQKQQQQQQATEGEAGTTTSAQPQVVEDEKEEEEERAWRAALDRTFRRVDALASLACACGRIVRPPCRCLLSCNSDIVGSTAVVAVLVRGCVVVANCGDSRAVLCRGPAGAPPVPLSRDHKPDRPDELARIEAAGGRVIYINGHRVRGILAMSRALGDRMLRPEVIAEPEITVTDRTPQDQCLILASDGMWDVISNEIACSVARQCLEDGNPSPADDEPAAGGGEGAAAGPEQEARCSRAASLLVRLALGRTTWDNVSVVVIDLKQRE
ncbi:hypothetical protein SETIT_6G005300v2 [Setaria italica]|uniref:protein-serine/threonine phosphatase n=1 Tax=Setaria italica TaxID=4555 RepID=A0A368RGT1_SETIT|nr:probable protein phosphatase 2C 37 [Setaria italica]RCV29342.1 hypothetical protein SETIT_6G005300v2 [Setaria italica]